jgi:hypothetical protein
MFNDLKKKKNMFSVFICGICKPRLRWLGHLYRTEELNPCKKLTFSKPMGTRIKEEHQ